MINKFIIIFILILFIVFINNIKIHYNNKKENFIIKNKDYNIKKKINLPFSCIYNIDNQCNNSNISKHLEWKCWLNRNKPKNDLQMCIINNDNIFSNYLNNTKLKYDGIFDLN